MIINRPWTLEDETLYRSQVDENITDAVALLEHAMQHIEREGTDADIDASVFILLNAQETYIAAVLRSEGVR